MSISQNPGGSNGIRITGSVTDVNNSLGGLTYNTSTGGDKTKAAKLLDVSYKTLLNKMREVT